MRILHLIPTLSGGGAERQLALMAREHAARGIDVAIIYRGEGPNFSLVENSEVTLFPLTLRGNHDPWALWAIISIIRQWRPDIVQTWLPQMDILGGIAARLTGVTHILSERASGPAYGEDWKSRMRAAIGRRAQTIIANSQVGLGYWQTLDACGAMHVVFNAISPFETRSGEVPAELVHPAILYAGRIAPQKNLEIMVAGLSQALSRKPDAHAYILGTGHLDSELRQWIAQTDVKERIHVLGYVNNPYPWYRHADVFISVSDFEGHPNVVLEAASIGCPLVLSDIPEHREAIPADGALFVDGHDPAQISDALYAVLNDRQASKARVRASKKFVAGLSVASQADKYLDIYHKIVRPKAQSSLIGRGVRPQP